MATRFELVAQVVRRRLAVAAERRRLLTHALHSDLHRPANDLAAPAHLEFDSCDLDGDAASEWSDQMSWADVTAPFARTRARGTIVPPLAGPLAESSAPVAQTAHTVSPPPPELSAPTLPSESARARGTIVPPLAGPLAEGSSPVLRTNELACTAANAELPAAAPLSEQVERLRMQAAACRAQAIALNAKLVMLEADRALLPEQCGQVHAVRELLIDGSARLDHAIEELGAVSTLELQLASLE